MRNFFISILVFAISSTAAAEECLFIDCEGLTGYVYVPDEVARGYQTRSYVKLNEIEYSLINQEKFPFVEIGLPDVNSIVTVGDGNISFYRNQDIPKIVKSLKSHQDIEYDKEKMLAKVNPFSQSMLGLDNGAKLKVLGYKQFGIRGIRDRLFVHVLYLSDK